MYNAQNISVTMYNQRVKFYIILFISIEILCQGAEMVDRFHRLLASGANKRRNHRTWKAAMQKGRVRVETWKEQNRFSFSLSAKFFSLPFCLYIVHQNYATLWIIAKQPTMPRNVLFKRCTTRMVGSFSILTFRLGWVEWEFYR